VSNLHIAWNPIGLVGGKVYGVKIDDLISIDVATGEAERLCAHVRAHAYHNGRLYAVVYDQDDKSIVRAFDLRRRAYRDLDSVRFGWERRPMAVSPDGKRLAFFHGLDGWVAACSYRLQLVDLDTGKVETLGPTVHARVFETGGQIEGLGPPFVWLDEKTILLVRDVPREVPGVDIFGAEARVATLDISSGELTDVLNLPRWNRRMREPYLRPLGKDGVPRIVLGELGQYRIDLEGKSLVEDNRVAGDYRWSRGREPEWLAHGNTRLAQIEKIPELAVSPDGRRIVWLTSRSSKSGELRYHDAFGGTTHTIAKGWFPRAWEPHLKPERSIFLWVDGDELAPGEVSEPPAPWQPLATEPWPVKHPPGEPDQRPNVADFLTMTISTDKPVYGRHEPVQLTVALTNRSARDVTFKPPEGYGNYFNLTMDYPRGSNVIDQFSWPENVFSTDPVVIPAGESFRVTRTIEPWDLGQHEVEGQFRLQTDRWGGRVEAETTTFVVEKSPDDDRLLKAKFDRLVDACRRQFDKDPATCNPWGLLDLGPGAVPHWVEFLESPANPDFRGRIAAPLVRIANAEALPYFEKLLAGDMKHDRYLVLESLLGMVQRGKARHEALTVLIGALEHSNVAVRREAAGRLRQIKDKAVAAGMEKAVDDDDAQTAVTAARYLAAYEDLDLADWLAAAAEQHTPAHDLAAHSIIKELEETWHISFGKLPNIGGDDRSKDPGMVLQYKGVLRAWEQWARENPRTSAHFFDGDREHWPKTTSDSGNEKTAGRVIVGRITDSSNQPVAGAAVEWGWYLDPHEKRERATTGEDGRYRLVVERLGADFRLGVFAEGLAPAWTDAALSWVRTAEGDDAEFRAESDFQLEPTHWIKGVLIDEQGKPVPGAKIRAETGVSGAFSSFSAPTPASPIPGKARETTTDEQGRFLLFNLPAGEVHLTVESPYRHVNSRNYPVDREARIVIGGSGKRGVIRAKVVDRRTGKPVQDFNVVLRHRPEPVHFTPPDGRFTFPHDARQGRRYQVHVYSRDHAPLAVHLTAVAEDGSEEPTIELSAGEPLLGQLVDARTQKPLADVPIMYAIIDDARYFLWAERDSFVDGQHGFTGVQRTTTRPDGTFFFSEGGDRARGALVIVTEGYERLILKPEDRSARDGAGRVRIGLMPEASVSGVCTRNGVPQADEEVAIWKYQPGAELEETHESVTTDGQGRFRFGALTAGTYQVYSPNVGRRFTLAAGRQQTVDLGEGLGTHTLQGEVEP